jgi:hypothetical protein
MTPDEVHAAVDASRAAQGLPPTIEDPVALDRIATILRAADRQQAKTAS